MAKKTTDHGSRDKIATLLLVCFFLSGMTGLIYEVLWTRMIVTVIGSAPFAVSIVLTVFMGGLGLGSYVAGRTIDRVQSPATLVRVYGILELVIGAYALLVPLLLMAFRPLYAIIYNRLYSQFMLYNVLTFIGCCVILLLPVICMGATLPILCRFYVTNLSYLGARAGRLYGLNTVGAAAGALLCGFWLISGLGMRGTLAFAVVINGLIGITAVLVGSRSSTIYSASNRGAMEGEGAQGGPGESRAVMVAALVIFGVSGFCAMAYEVIWTRLLGLIVGPTTYSFTIVLVTFILGLALGSMFFGWLADRTKRPIWLLIFTQIAAGLSVLGVSQLMGNSQLFFAKLIFHFQNHFGLLSFSKAAALFAFMILPTLCLGATFPLVGKIYTQALSKVGRSIGFAYAVNTAGAVLGSFCAGFVLIPLLGKEKSLGLVVGAQLATSLIVGVLALIWGKPQRTRKAEAVKLAPLAAAAAGLVLCFILPAWNHRVLSSGKYHRFEDIEVEMRTTGWIESLLKGPDILTKAERARVVYYGDGIGGFTTVLKYPDPLSGGYFSMANSGKMDASSRGDMQTQTLLAHFPMLFHPDAKNVMVLGLASGITAGEVLHYPIEQLDILEISRVVVGGSRFFDQWNNNVLANAKTRLIIQDARAHLALTRQKYDVIISEPSNPWMEGLATLFTREFFAMTKDRLTEGGMFVQFLHSYEMDWPTFAVVGRAFAEVFPNSVLTLAEPAGTGGDYLFVGFQGQGRLSLDNVRRNLQYAQQSKNIVLRDPRLLYRFVVSEDLRRLFGVGAVNTDNRPILEFAAPRLMYTRDLTIGDNIRSRQWFSFTSSNIMRQIAVDIDAQIDFAEYALSVHAPFNDMVDLSRAGADQRERLFRIFESYCARQMLDISILTDKELLERCCAVQMKVIEQNIQTTEDKSFAYRYLADLCLVQNSVDKAIENYLKDLEIDPQDSAGHFNLALAFSRQGNLDQAMAHFHEAVRIRPALAIRMHRSLGRILASHNRPEEAAAEYEQYLRLQPEDAQVHNALGQVLRGLRRLEEAIEHFAEAVRLRPDFDDALENLRYAQARLYEQRQGRQP
ncbi:MAG TPA: fused MFS/spermidine synthase [Sedimentisphaerales bacterium]|nr:fused MFS/spermidine synthase [Sedimentisphaerales bacterium]